MAEKARRKPSEQRSARKALRANAARLLRTERLEGIRYGTGCVTTKAPIPTFNPANTAKPFPFTQNAQKAAKRGKAACEKGKAGDPLAWPPCVKGAVRKADWGIVKAGILANDFIELLRLQSLSQQG